MKKKQTCILPKSGLMAEFFVFFALLSAFDVVARDAPWVGETLAGGYPCRGGWLRFGPYDYTKSEDRKQLEIVESYHFTPEVERLIGGRSGSLMGDIDYTLRAFPNHHKALLSAQRYQATSKEKTNQYTAIECYFQRALNFSPKDGVVHMLYGVYLHKAGYLDKALLEYVEAKENMPNNAGLHYNMGLLYLDLKKFRLAKEQAVKAYKIGYPFSGLKDRLKKLGYW